MFNYAASNTPMGRTADLGVELPLFRSTARLGIVSLIGYDDGCIDACVDSPPSTFSAKGTIAGQSSGPRLYAAFDPVPTADRASPSGA